MIFRRESGEIPERLRSESGGTPRLIGMEGNGREREGIEPLFPSLVCCRSVVNSFTFPLRNVTVESRNGEWAK